MEVGMSSCEDSDTEEERPGVLDDALKDATGWIDLESANNMPQLSIKNIHQYFIKRKVRKDQVTASKPFEQGYRIYDAKKVRSISIYQTSNDNLFSVIKAAVLPSQRTDKVYETIIVVYNTTGNIYYATCTCTAGEGGSCNHVAALSFAIDAHNRTNPTPSCTSLPSKWNVPKSTKAPKDIPVSTLHIKKPSHLKPKKTGLPSPHTPISPSMSQVTIDRIMKLRQDLSEHCTHTLLFHQVWPETTDQRQIARLNLHRTSPLPSTSSSSP